MKRRLGILLVAATISVRVLAAEKELATIELRHRLPEEMATLVRPLLDEGETVIAAPSSLIIKASLPKIQEINALVQELDKKQHRLLITVAQGRGLTLDALNARASVRVGIDASRPGDPAINARGHVYQTESLERDEQTQGVQTLDGQAATIRFGGQVPLPQGGMAYGYPRGPVIINQGIEYREVSTGFSVLPRLTGEQVILEIAPWSDRISRQGGGLIDTQNAETTVRTSLGQWVEIGGQVEGLNREQSGVFAHSYSTRSEANRIFIKVDDLDAR
ncbi:MAG: hypothetical protein H6R26_49 [Proteobacteria bacterium]|nr:hypothetical protein [Pseudomonadota bacterium]